MDYRAAGGWSPGADLRSDIPRPGFLDDAGSPEQPRLYGRSRPRASLRSLAWFWGGILAFGFVGAATLQLLGPPVPASRVAEASRPPAPRSREDLRATPSQTNPPSPKAAEPAAAQDAPVSAPPTVAGVSGTQEQVVSGPKPSPDADALASATNRTAAPLTAESTQFAALPPAPGDTVQPPGATASMDVALAAPSHPAEARPAEPEAAQPAAPRVAAAEPEMIWLPAGKFRMGSNEDRSERPVHTVTVVPVAMSKYAVTVREWQRCVEAKACTLIPRGKPDQPVTNVSWDDANGFTAWLSNATGHHYRLPTEAEWEFAARAGAETRYTWGNAVVPSKVSCKGCGGPVDALEPPPVDAYPPNIFGLYGMGGGVAEWVADCWHRDYQGAPHEGNAPWDASDCRQRVLRGGSWMSDPDSVRASSREYYDAAVRYPTHGFRIVQP
jgi:formylglycine-generating enzyme required for sulfatase activity